MMLLKPSIWQERVMLDTLKPIAVSLDTTSAIMTRCDGRASASGSSLLRSG